MSDACIHGNVGLVCPDCGSGPQPPKCPVCFLPMSLYVYSYKVRGNYACANIHCTHRGQVSPTTGRAV